MVKVCVICSKEFEPIKANERKALCCSQLCNQRNWRKKNPDKNRKIKINWRRSKGVVEKGSQDHRKKMAELAKGNKHRNKGGYENHLMHGRKRAKMMSMAKGWHSKLDWEGLKSRYNYTCLCCEKREPNIKLTKDHIVPLTLGGGNHIENIQPLCQSCNSRKLNKTINYKERWQLLGVVM